MKDLENMIEYIETDKPRMIFLCHYLGDNSKYNLNNCDNSGQKKLTVSVTKDWSDKIKAFWDNFFPVLEVESKNSKMVNGVAASYYGVSSVGSAIHRSKYENGGDFPDFLVKLVLKAIRKNFGNEKFDLILYVPPTTSGDLVKNLAIKVSRALKIPISHDLIKIKETKEQKAFENKYLKRENVKDAFNYSNPSTLQGKSILLIDDIFDTGATMQEIGRKLTKLGASKITPVVIAKAVGGDLI